VDRFRRRLLLSGAGAMLAAPSLVAPGLARAQTGEAGFLPSPDLSVSPEHPPRFIAGLRPWRRGTFRLEPGVSGDKLVVHNYGHGGAGITMSWGCAVEVRTYVAALLETVSSRRVAVLGAGVMGLTAATLLRELDVPVTVYAEKFTPHTTSDVAGGQWAPSVVEHADETRFRRILRNAWAMHQNLGAGFGVSQRDNYTFRKANELRYAALSGAPEPQQLSRLPFANVTHDGWRYPTLLVEPPILLKRLSDNLQASGVEMKTMSFKGAASVQALEEPILVNCLGLGSRKVWPDDALHGRKGQLALLKAQPHLKYLYSGIGYMFPRQDHLVVGGSVEYPSAINEDDTPDPVMGMQMIRIVKAVFDGALPLPPWLAGAGGGIDQET